MTIENLRLHYTYGLALLVLLGAFALLVVETPGITGGEKLAFLAGLTTAVVGFVFGREQASDSARQTLRAVDKGAQGTGTGTTVNADTANVEGGDPTVVNRA